jgi:hypothetical protein
VSLGRANLLFDEIEIVEQPFPGRRDPAVRLDRGRQQVAGLDQDRLVLGQPLQKRSGARPKASVCDSARVLPCCFIWSLLNSSDRSGGSAAANFWAKLFPRRRAPQRIKDSRMVLLFTCKFGVSFLGWEAV